jgi:hypothetical protein
MFLLSKKALSVKATVNQLICYCVCNISLFKDQQELAKSIDRELLYRQVLLLLDFTKLTPKASDHLNRTFAAYASEIAAK